MIAELKTLLAVARFGTFAAAGERVGLTQAAVSGQMKRLEERLGVTLFDRTGRSASLNAAGKRTLERARAIISLYDHIAEPNDNASKGRIRLGAIASVQSTILARALVTFQSLYPRHHIHVHSDISLRLLDQIDAGELDLAVVIKPSYGIPSGLTWQTLIEEPYILAVPQSALGDNWISLLQQLPFIRYERSSLGGRQVDRFLRDRAITIREVIEIDDLPAIMALVAQGVGAAILPMSEVNSPLMDRVRKVPLDPTFYREIGILNARQDEAAIDSLSDCLIAAREEPMPIRVNVG
ncbi:LysR family transcriptional regulator [Ensifer sp. ENS04]|uniref:LysR substrate-binding domain-containing protein n=1 Tax=Ensifer sp. ENS04 TaxID=2769281 RepID=UPI001786916F|nr:LysR substrate-binding domain-containing protein [Ensifer sp. ENS04]MBD9544762.1 LysR family transcriptional regulator [Ensifer sp. ENS04]